MRIVPDDDDPEREVMTSLPRSRPTRRSSKRADRPGTATASDAPPGQREPRRTPRPKPDAAPAPAKPRRTPRPKPATVTAAASSPAPEAAPAPAPRRTPRPRPDAASAAAPPPVPETAPAPAPRRTPRPKPAAVTDSAAATGNVPGAPSNAAPHPPPPRSAPRRKVPAAGYAAPSAREDEPASPVHDLVTTTVLAAGELAQIGLDVGRSALRSFFDRLPKP